MFVPVKTKDGQHLMPMHAARARKLVQRAQRGITAILYRPTQRHLIGITAYIVSVSTKNRLIEIHKRFV